LWFLKRDKRERELEGEKEEYKKEEEHKKEEEEEEEEEKRRRKRRMIAYPTLRTSFLTIVSTLTSATAYPARHP